MGFFLLRQMNSCPYNQLSILDGINSTFPSVVSSVSHFPAFNLAYHLAEKAALLVLAGET